MRDVVDLHVRQRRWNAAALQRYLRRQAEARATLTSMDLPAVARELHGELQGGPNGLDLVRQAWGYLILIGLVAPDPGGAAGWRLADAPHRAPRRDARPAGRGAR